MPRLEMRREAATDLRAVFESRDRLEAERKLHQVVDKYAPKAPKLSSWMEANVAERLTVFAFPEVHRRRLRTSNLLERISRESKRRTRVAALFPKEAALLRLVNAVLMEISYWPPYSPDYNPIEFAWSKMKTRRRSRAARTRSSLYRALGSALQTITAQDARAWLRHDGYRLH